MQAFALKPSQTPGYLAAFVIAAALLCAPGLAQDDPPDQAGRISSISGTVSVQPNGSDDWGQVYPNLPVGPGDRIFTDQNGRAEIQVGQSYLRIGPNTDITFVDEQPGEITFGMAQGSLHVRSYGFWPGQGLDVSTPNGDARLSEPGEFRTDVIPDQGATIFTSMGSEIAVSGAGDFNQPMGPGQSLEVAGTNPVYPQWLQPNGFDALDQWSEQRDSQIAGAVSYQYVSPDVPGAAELDANGDWTPDSDYGPMWFPRNVSADWQPYRYGHWINREPWGWVWVEDEPWGYAPFHYGRWISYRGRWGWVPGPRESHPVWSPALVVFAGGGGVGISAWFPLGPGEPYRPWYRCSPGYIDRVNITNIHRGRNVQVQTTYVNIVNVRNVNNITYVNRTAGVTAMRQEDFAAGRSVRQAAVQFDRARFDHVQVIDRPAPVTRQSFVNRPVAHPVPVSGYRPTFINNQGMQIGARPGAAPQPTPVRPMQPMRPIPGRTVVNPPPGTKRRNQGGNWQNAPNQGETNQGDRNRNQGDRPARGNDGGQQQYPNQNYPNQPANNSHGQQPGPVPAAPGVQPTGRPILPSRGQQEGNPNPPQNERRFNPPPNNSTPPPPQLEHRNVQPPPPSFRNEGPPPQQDHRNAEQPPPPRGNQADNGKNDKGRNDQKDEKKDDRRRPQ
jgi:hypothetical protein